MSDTCKPSSELREAIKEVRSHNASLAKLLEPAALDGIMQLHQAAVEEAVRAAKIATCEALLIGSVDYDDFVERVTNRIAELQKGQGKR